MGLSVNLGCNQLSTGAVPCALCHQLRGTEGLVAVTESHKGPGSPGVLLSPAAHPAERGRGGPVLSSPSRGPRVALSTPAGFVPSFQSSSLKVFQRCFLSLQLKVQEQTSPAEAINSRATHRLHLLFLCLISHLFPQTLID